MRVYARCYWVLMLYGDDGRIYTEARQCRRTLKMTLAPGSWCWSRDLSRRGVGWPRKASPPVKNTRDIFARWSMGFYRRSSRALTDIASLFWRVFSSTSSRRKQGSPIFSLLSSSSGCFSWRLNDETRLLLMSWGIDSLVIWYATKFDYLPIMLISSSMLSLRRIFISKMLKAAAASSTKSTRHYANYYCCFDAVIISIILDDRDIIIIVSLSKTPCKGEYHLQLLVCTLPGAPVNKYVQKLPSSSFLLRYIFRIFVLREIPLPLSFRLLWYFAFLRWLLTGCDADSFDARWKRHIVIWLPENNEMFIISNVKKTRFDSDGGKLMMRIELYWFPFQGGDISFL